MHGLKQWWKQLWCDHFPMKTIEEPVPVHRYYALGGAYPLRTLVGTAKLDGDSYREHQVVSSTKIRIHLQCNLCGWHKSYWRDGAP